MVFGVLLIFSFILHCNTRSNRLIPVVKCLRPRQRQRVPLYSLYVFVALTNICYKWLLWVMEGIVLFFILVLNLIFGFGFVISWSKEIFCDHWFYSKGMLSAFVSKSLLTNSSVINFFSDVCITLSLSHCGIIYLFFGWISSIPKC